MENNLPKTKEECFAQFDALLSEEDKDVLKNSEDIFDYHFTLGMWIRNNWIYSMNDEELQSLMKNFEKEDDELPFGFMNIHPDEVSSFFIEKYVEYLKSKGG